MDAKRPVGRKVSVSNKPRFYLKKKKSYILFIFPDRPSDPFEDIGSKKTTTSYFYIPSDFS